MKPDALPDENFMEFWVLYPRRVGRKAAFNAWKKIPQKNHATILAALAAWRKVWAGLDPQFIPHASSWLNGERWTDELPPPPASVKPASSAHVPFVAPPVPEGKVPMPDHVRAQLGAFLRKAGGGHA